MPKTTFIHGYASSPTHHWGPWLRTKLEEAGHSVEAPSMPHPKEPQLQEWLDFFESEVPHGSEDMLVGHSLGVPFILHWLEQHPAKAAFLVGGFGSKLSHPVGRFSDHFVESFDWEAIGKHCPQFTLYHSDNDPYVPLEKAQELEEKLGGTLLLIPGGGHLNTEAGYTTFPKLLEGILVV